MCIRDSNRPLGGMPKINSNGGRYVFVSHNAPPVTSRLLVASHAPVLDIVENGTRQEAKCNAVLIIFVLYYFLR